MLTHHRKPVCFSLMALDMPLWSVVDSAATIYEKEPGRFHVLFTEPLVQGMKNAAAIRAPRGQANAPDTGPSRLLWLEVSPYRVIMTMQGSMTQPGSGKVSYRHFWEQGVFGASRYWFQQDELSLGNQMRLRNYTRSLTLTANPLPQSLRVEYELWAAQVQLGHYILNLEIH